MAPSGSPLSVVVSLFAVTGLAFAQAPAPTPQSVKNELDGLRSEVQSLKQQQATILQQLTAIQQYLQRQQQPQAQANPIINVKGAPMRGSSQAKVAVVEYTDYWCGFCARFAQQTMPEIVKEYVDSGKVRYYLMDFAAQHGPKVAQAARCAGDQNKYWQMHDTLFANFGKYDDKQLIAYAGQIGADPTLFQKCVAAGEHAGDVQKGMESGTQAGVDGTPTFMIGVIDPAVPDQVKTLKRIVGAQPLDSFKAAVDSVLAEAQ